MENAVAYARYSTDNQNEKSIAYQVKEIEKYCKNNDLKLIDVYFDEAKTGFNTKRDDFNRMIADAERNKFDCIVIYDISRMSRNVKDWFSAREK